MFAQVKIFVGASQSYAANDPNVRMFNDNKVAKIFSASSFRRRAGVEGLRELLQLLPLYCDDMLSNAEFMEETRHADLVVGELYYLCGSLVADKLSLPLVMISAASLASPTSIALGLPSPPSYVPQWDVALSDEFNFVDRVQNVLKRMILYMIYIYDLCPMYAEIKAKHNITPNKTIQDTLSRADLIIGQMDFMLEPPRPLLPTWMLCLRPERLPPPEQIAGHSSCGSIPSQSAKPLPNELDQFMQKAGNEGVILVAFGSNPRGIEEASLQMMAAAFSKLPQKDLRFAESVNLETTSAEEFVSLIHKVLTQSSYRESAARISNTIKRLPRTPVKEAADWVEYTQAQGGLQYLRPRGLDLPFYQLYLLDILFVAFVILVVGLFDIRFLLKAILKCLLGSSNKEKVN
ncbi:hypothetical protein OS493_014734 [Desmophyllum pertusum]|uniref:Glucuronosyltransferase n=1 Tax=Desmophyllum pertusum TaxID=174260 RepID=A0A9W9YD33_9CNID|nr:hypothetical protein OS493_014734 [Desmophyllum pertusum]